MVQKAVKHNFQVHLSGIIDLLSNHLYSGPQVFVRELLQNAVDAISARRNEDPDHEGEISIEAIEVDGRPHTLVVIDNGIGLQEEEIHRFLATIGQTSKRRDELLTRTADFIGQFGVGLLSCFVVSQEIVVITKSIKPDSPTVEWRGHSDGTYSIKILDKDIAPGTQVYLTAKADSAEFFTPARIRELCEHFGSLLPYPIKIVNGTRKNIINESGVPWERAFLNQKDKIAFLKKYGEETFNISALDCIELRSQVGKIEGVAYVLPYAPSLTGKRTHKVYLKHMLLSEHAEGLLPDWAFFVKCVLNANDLRPTASRESFYEDEALEEAREELGNCLRQYLVDLAENDLPRLEKLISLHYLAIKAIAIQDDELYKLFINLLPFQTSLGFMTLSEYKQRSGVIQYVRDVDQFRQVSRIAAAQGICLINAGYAYDSKLLERLPAIFPDLEVELIEPSMLVQQLEDLDFDERERAFDLIRTADLVLQPFKCAAEVKKFKPSDLPALYSANDDALFKRTIEQTKDQANSMWSGILDGVAEDIGRGYSQLCFNLDNPLIKKMCGIKDRKLLQQTIEMLYVQSLLLGHHPLHAKEQELLNNGMIGLIEYCLRFQTE